MIAPGHIVGEETDFPRTAFESSLGAGQPGGGKSVQALAARGEEAQVVAVGGYFTQEGSALGCSQNVAETPVGPAASVGSYPNRRKRCRVLASAN